MEEHLVKKSVKLSWFLRHNKDNLKENVVWNGFVPVSVLLKALDISFNDLVKIVDTDNKGRYSFNNEKTELRANQGHSIPVELDLKSSIPPLNLYHGTTVSVKDIILKEGLKSMSRNHVHLTDNLETAVNVANRRKQDIVIFKLDVKQMILDNILFFKSDNGVWLTDFVDSKYLMVFKNEKK